MSWLGNCTRCGKPTLSTKSPDYRQSDYTTDESGFGVRHVWCPVGGIPAEPTAQAEVPALRRSASPIEQRFWEAALRDWWPELPLVPEHSVRAGGRDYRIDFAVPGWHFGIELDGFRNHSSTADIARDHRRQRALERAGWTICRFGGQEVTRNAAACVLEAQNALYNLITGEARATAADTGSRAWLSAHPPVRTAPYASERMHNPYSGSCPANPDDCLSDIGCGRCAS
jgi:very-short-patch-repair endonuclease